MKKKGLITMLLVCLIALVGIGYAAISKELIINGTANATVDNENFSVVFDDDAEVVQKNCVAADTKVNDDATATITVDGTKLTKTGDTATATFTIKNTSAELGASLSAVISGNVTTDEYFTVTHSFAQTSIAKGASTTITVTIKLDKTPIENVTGTFKVTITATATVA